MPAKLYYERYKQLEPPKEPPKPLAKSPNRFTWLRMHPEDMWIDRENQIVRKTGYEDSEVKSLMAAICLRACIDYKSAITGSKVDGRMPMQVIWECREFFESDMFQYFVNGMPVEEIDRFIRATPKGKIHALWKAAVE